MSLLEFELASVEVIEPWGSPPNLSLHWFGLSDGKYHIDLGAVRLLENAPREGWPHFVEYQLARIHEDVLAMLPDVLEPIPSSTTRHFIDGRLGETLRHLRQRWDTVEADNSSLDASLEALGNRQLDTAYLNPSAGIWIWTDGLKTIIEWDNRDRLVDGKPAWTATHGRHEMARDVFIDEVRAFHLKLMAAMDERVQQVCSNWTRPEIKIDLERLVVEQIERSESFAPVVHRSPRTTNWQPVQMALSRTGRSA
jgi:hypothetical protein